MQATVHRIAKSRHNWSDLAHIHILYSYSWPLNNMGLNCAVYLYVDFFNSIYYSTVQSVAGWMHRWETTDREEHCTYYTKGWLCRFSTVQRVCTPNLSIVQGSTVLFYKYATVHSMHFYWIVFGNDMWYISREWKKILGKLKQIVLRTWYSGYNLNGNAL